MIFRVRFQHRGGHVHCRVFQATAPGQTWTKNGELTFDEQGWVGFVACVNPRLEFVPDEAAERVDDADLPSAEDVLGILKDR